MMLFECRFFSPTMNSLTSRGHNLHILCMSTVSVEASLSVVTQRTSPLLCFLSQLASPLLCFVSQLASPLPAWSLCNRQPCAISKHYKETHLSLFVFQAQLRKMSSGTDPTWKYGHEVNAKDGKGGYECIECNFCTRTIKRGVYRMKEHLAGTKGNVAPCTMVPLEVQSKIKEFMKKKQDTKKVAQLYREERINECVSLCRTSFCGSNSISQRTVRGLMDRFVVNIEEGELEDNLVRPSQ